MSISMTKLGRATTAAALLGIANDIAEIGRRLSDFKKIDKVEYCIDELADQAGELFALSIKVNLGTETISTDDIDDDIDDEDLFGFTKPKEEPFVPPGLTKRILPTQVDPITELKAAQAEHQAEQEHTPVIPRDVMEALEERATANALAATEAKPKRTRRTKAQIEADAAAAAAKPEVLSPTNAEPEDEENTPFDEEQPAVIEKDFEKLLAEEADEDEENAPFDDESPAAEAKPEAVAQVVQEFQQGEDEPEPEPAPKVAKPSGYKLPIIGPIPEEWREYGIEKLDLNKRQREAVEAAGFKQLNYLFVADLEKITGLTGHDRVAVEGALKTVVHEWKDELKESGENINRALAASLFTVAGAAGRWAQARETGMSDAQLKDAIGNEYATCPRKASATGIPFEAKGGTSPKLWAGDPIGKPDLTGTALVHKVRLLLQIPKPKPVKKTAEPDKLFNVMAGKNFLYCLSGTSLEAATAYVATLHVGDTSITVVPRPADKPNEEEDEDEEGDIYDVTANDGKSIKPATTLKAFDQTAADATLTLFEAPKDTILRAVKRRTVPV